MKFTATLPLFFALSACAPNGEFPSLAHRPIEAKAAALLANPQSSPQPIAAPDAALRAQLLAVQDAARASTPEFESAAAKAEKLVAAAGSAQSESWIAAEMEISAVERARAPVKTALADLDAMVRLLMTDKPNSPDLPLVQQAIRDTETLDAGQDETVQRLTRALAR